MPCADYVLPQCVSLKKRWEDHRVLRKEHFESASHPNAPVLFRAAQAYPATVSGASSLWVNRHSKDSGLLMEVRGTIHMIDVPPSSPLLEECLPPLKHERHRGPQPAAQAHNDSAFSAIANSSGNMPENFSFWSPQRSKVI